MVNIRLHFKWRLLLISGSHWNTDLLLLQPWCREKEGWGQQNTKVKGKRRVKNNGKHVLLFKITWLWGLFGLLKTWFCMRLIVWCNFRPSSSAHPGDLSSFLRSSFCKCRLSRFTHRPQQTRLCKQLHGTRTWIHLKKFTMKSLFCRPDAPRGRFFKQDVQWCTLSHSSPVFLALKAVWSRKSLLNVVPLSRSRLWVCHRCGERNAAQHQHSHRKLPLSSNRFLLMVV